MKSFASVEEYRLDSGDYSSKDERIEAVLTQQSAKLRAKAGISGNRVLSEDQQTIARLLVTDAARKMLVRPAVEGLEDVSGVKQSSFSADGFQSSYTFENASGSAYFDKDTLKAFIRSLKKSQQIGMIMPYYGS